jgi:hypothetical protein
MPFCNKPEFVRGLSCKSCLLDIFVDFRSHDPRVAWYLLSFKMRRYSMPLENSDYNSALLSAN